jgi:hypothetical protein
MELDDLKDKWRLSTDVPTRVGLHESLERSISEFEKSGKGIRRMFFIEVLFVLAVYVMFISIVWILGDRVMGYLIKLVAIVGIGFLPVLWRLYKSQKWINSMDYTMDIRSNIHDFLVYYKRTLSIYKWSSYIVIVLTLVMLFADREFVSLPMWIKIVIVAYMITIFLLTAPYIRMAYGRKTEAFERFLDE